jgi:hypothetical protein
MAVLNSIPFVLDPGAIREECRVEEGSDDAARLAEIVARAAGVARPKALFAVAHVEERAEDSVTIGGVRFASRVLRANLAGAERVFAYVATCGGEMDDIERALDDPFERYWLDAVKARLLRAARAHLDGHLSRAYALGRTATMAPGAADPDVWPIEQQRELFSLLGDVEGLIGVRLTASCLMVPNKSVSGVRFPTERDYRSCRVCTRERCPGRSAPYDPALARALRGAGALDPPEP